MMTFEIHPKVKFNLIVYLLIFKVNLESNRVGLRKHLGKHKISYFLF